MTDAEKSRVAEFAVAGPLNEANLDDDLGTNPVGAETWEADGFGEKRLRSFETVELFAELKQQFSVEARADLAGIDEVICGDALTHVRATAPFARPAR